MAYVGVSSAQFCGGGKAVVSNQSITSETYKHPRRICPGRGSNAQRLTCQPYLNRHRDRARCNRGTWVILGGFRDRPRQRGCLISGKRRAAEWMLRLCLVRTRVVLVIGSCGGRCQATFKSEMIECSMTFSCHSRPRLRVELHAPASAKMVLLVTQGLHPCLQFCNPLDGFWPQKATIRASSPPQFKENMSVSTVSLVNTLGMEFLGFAIATWLFGVNTVQACTYFRKYDDRLFVKLTACAVISLDVANSVACCWGLYVEVLGNLSPLNIPLVVQAVTGVVIVFIVQCFLARTIWHVSGKRKWLTSIVVTLAALSCSLGFVYSIQTLVAQKDSTPGSLQDLRQQYSTFELLLAVAIVLPTLTDVIITASLIFFLRRGRALTPISSTSNIVDRLMIFFAQRGILITLSQVAVVILDVSMPSMLAWTLVQYSLAKVYIHTLLVLLNRRGDRTDGTTTDVNQMMPTLSGIQANPDGQVVSHEAVGVMESSSPRDPDKRDECASAMV